MADNINQKGDEQEVSVYETVSEEADSYDSGEEPREGENQDEAAEAPEGAKKGLSLKTLYIIAGVLGLFIIALVAFAIILTKIKSNSVYPEGSVILTQPVSESNNANYIFTSDDMVINDVEVKLQGILLDRQASVLYFDRAFKVGCMDLFLRDSFGNVYYMDLSRHTKNDYADKLYFQPFREGITYFELAPAEDGSSAIMVYYFDRELELPPAIYAQNQSLELELEGASALFKIDEAVFSSAGTFINYSFSWDDERFKIMQYEDKPRLMKVYDNKAVVSALKGYASQDSVKDKLIMGREGFRPLRNLSGTARVVINNLYSSVVINKTAEAAPLFRNDSEHSTEIRFGDYKLVLERMGKGGSSYLLVLHSEDLRLPAPTGPGDYSNRVEISYDIELIGKNETGSKVALKPEAYLSKNGADFVFHDTEKEIVYRSPDDVEIKINSAEIKMDDVVFDLKLSGLPQNRDENTQNVIESIIMLYEYNNRDLDKYTVQVNSHTVSNDEVTLVVYEAGIKDGEVFLEKSAVTAAVRNGGVDILSDTKL